MQFRLSVVITLLVLIHQCSEFHLVTCFGRPIIFTTKSIKVQSRRHVLHEAVSPPAAVGSLTSSSAVPEPVVSAHEIFQNFVTFLQIKQSEIISALEEADPTTKFSLDKWGYFLNEHEMRNGTTASSSTNSSTTASSTTRSGGITRVLQGGSLVEKGAVSLTIIEQAVLSQERAKAIRARSAEDVCEGDVYSAAALSIVLHTRSPMVPTFRSDVRIFLVQTNSTTTGSNDDRRQEKKNHNNTSIPVDTMAWFGGGADLTPYYIFEEDIQLFHQTYRIVCDRHFQNNGKTYREMKKLCDDYFYLPARREHRGTGGIFFDDLIATESSLQFAMDVVNSWMPSWLDTIVERRKSLPYTDQQRQWQLLRRGRYLEFNLLYDRGVRFGLAGENPRVEGVMVSAPPLIAFAYNHRVDKDSEEEKLIHILKEPRDWLTD
jgi:coproporphyrinogen III oxidase